MTQQNIKDFLVSLNSHCLLQPPKAIVEIRRSETLIRAGDTMPEDSQSVFQSKSLLVHIAGVFESSTPVCLMTEQCGSIEKADLQQICADQEEYLFQRCEDIEGPFGESWWLVLKSVNREDKRECSMRIIFASYTEKDGEETGMLICDTESIKLVE